jgi:hypothetical protein
MCGVDAEVATLWTLPRFDLRYPCSELVLGLAALDRTTIVIYRIDAAGLLRSTRI